MTAPAAQAGAAPGSREEPWGNGFDRYGGSTAVQLAATGRFRTARVRGRWWLVDPDGHPFFSAGVNNVAAKGTPDANGHYAYADAVEARYGTPQNWADAQLIRFRDWGVNTIGAWGEPDLPLFAGRIPYTPIIGLAEDETGELQDFFAARWRRGVDARVQEATRPRRDDPWLIGYYTDNEIKWLADGARRTLLDIYLARPAGAPGKRELVRFLRRRYLRFERLKSDFPVLTATSWRELAQPAEASGLVEDAGARATIVAWTGRVAKRYFAVTGRALRRADRRHLNLGTRFIAQGTPRPVVEAAGRHVDVVSVNFYEVRPEVDEQVKALLGAYQLTPTARTLEAFSETAGKPVLISEFGYRAADAGLPNTLPRAMVVLPTQQARGEATRNYVRCALNTRFIVGTHWFEMTDDPATGRQEDGQDANFGLVSERDDPYTAVTDALADLHAEAYGRLANGRPLACAPVGLQ